MTTILAAGAVGSEDLVRFWAALAVLLVVARGLGLVAKRLGQPAVIGELAAGIVLGPTVLARLAPDVSEWLFGGDVASIMVTAVSWLGVVLLLAVTGFETDLGMLKRLGRAAAWTSATSLVIPFALGLGLAAMLPATFQGEGGGPAFLLFMGVALAISALPVVAKVLREMGVIGRPVGQVTLAAGMVNDLVGWVLLGLVAGLARTGSVDAQALGVTVLGIVAFLGLAMTVGQRAVDWLLRSTAIRDRSDASTVGMAMVIVLLAGAATQALGVEAVLGAFVAGILLSRSPLGGHKIEKQISAATDGFLAPVFFATAGLSVDLGAVLNPDVLPWAVAVVAVATIGKVAGGLLGGVLGGLRTVEGLAVGVGLNARGALEIVVATIGLGLGVLTDVAYSVIVVMAVLTSMMAPPALTAISRRLGGGESSDAATPVPTAGSVVLSARSALLPTRGGVSSVLAGRLLDAVLPTETRITALTVHPPELDAEQGRQAAKAVGRLVGRRMTWRERVSHSASTAILDEAELGYDVIAVGASAEEDAGIVSPVLAEILTSATVPVLIIRSATDEQVDRPIRHIVSTVDGSLACDAARDVAASLAAQEDAQLDLVHVLPPEDLKPSRVPSTAPRALDRAEVMGRAARSRAQQIGVESSFVIRSDRDVALGVRSAMEEVDADLVVIGTRVRMADDEIVLGRTAERLLADPHATVMVLAVPPAARQLGQ